MNLYNKTETIRTIDFSRAAELRNSVDIDSLVGMEQFSSSDEPATEKDARSMASLLLNALSEAINCEPVRLKAGLKILCSETLALSRDGANIVFETLAGVVTENIIFAAAPAPVTLRPALGSLGLHVDELFINVDGVPETGANDAAHCEVTIQGMSPVPYRVFLGEGTNSIKLDIFTSQVNPLITINVPSSTAANPVSVTIFARGTLPEGDLSRPGTGLKILASSLKHKKALKRAINIGR